MGLFKRLRDLTMASIYDVLDKAEDPEKMLNQYLRDMEEDLQEVLSAVARQVAAEKKLKQQYDEAAATVQQHEELALKALEQGKEDLARRILQEKKEKAALMEQLKSQHDSAKSSADRLRAQLEEMKEEIQKLKNKKQTLIARAKSAKLQKNVNDVVSGYGTNSAAKGFERMEEKVLQLESEAEVSLGLNAKNVSLEQEIAELVKDDGIEDELAALKSRLKGKSDANS
jgi:phage shock protein A